MVRTRQRRPPASLWARACRSGGADWSFEVPGAPETPACRPGPRAGPMTPLLTTRHVPAGLTPTEPDGTHPHPAPARRPACGRRAAPASVAREPVGASLARARALPPPSPAHRPRRVCRSPWGPAGCAEGGAASPSPGGRRGGAVPLAWVRTVMVKGGAEGRCDDRCPLRHSGRHQVPVPCWLPGQTTGVGPLRGHTLSGTSGFVTVAAGLGQAVCSLRDPCAPCPVSAASASRCHGTDRQTSRNHGCRRAVSFHRHVP